MIAISPLITMFEMKSGASSRKPAIARAVGEEHDYEHRPEAEDVHQEVVLHEHLVRRRQHADQAARELELAAFSIGLAAMNSLQRSMMRRDVVALVVAGRRTSRARWCSSAIDVLRGLGRRRAGEEDEEELPPTSRPAVRDHAPLRLELVEHHVDGAEDVGEREAVADARGRARGSAGTSPCVRSTCGSFIASRS